MKIMPINDRIKFRSVSMVNKALNNQAPEYICNMFSLNNPLNSRPQRKCKNVNSRLVLPHCTKEFARKTLRYTESQMYNGLPDSVACATSIKQFKSSYLANYYAKCL